MCAESRTIESTIHTTNLFGYQISQRGIKGDVAQALEFISSDQNGRYMVCANPHSLVVASNDTVFRSSLNSADLMLPDGAGIVLAARMLALPHLDRVAGYEFFYRLSASLAKDGGARYFFLGSSVHVLSLITKKLSQEFPEITVCGTLSPPFKREFSEEDNAAMISAINDAQPDVLWVGMTAPKQEKWIYGNRDKLFVPFIGPIGAVFDFYAGTRKRSSEFWQKIGMEWLPRFLREPRRLWERNLKSTPIFLYWIVKEMFKRLLVRQ